LHEKQKRSQFPHRMKLLEFPKKVIFKACILNDLYRQTQSSEI